MQLGVAFLPYALCSGLFAAGEMENNFVNPPDSARPGVYWYFLNGNINGKEMTADLESMKAVGLGNLIFLEVNIFEPPGDGPVAFMSPKWQELFVQSVRDAERLGINISLGIGPGWSGSGGPWVKPEQAMQHLDYSSVDLTGPQSYSAVLPQPKQHATEYSTIASPFYEDVAVFAFPSRKPLIADIREKALFFRDFSTKADFRPYFSTSASYVEPGPAGVIQPDQIVDLTKQIKPDGTLNWNVPAGDWTIVRMGRRPTGACTNPAPLSGFGLECDKFDAKALDDHLSHYVGILLDKIRPRAAEHGLTTLHMDSWEPGAQNWTSSFLDEFKKRRGYDARSWLLTYTGRAVESLEKSERFLWDLRLTAQELVLEKHAGEVKKYAHKNGLSLSIEPYDMNPAGDLDLGAVSDVPMGEFWNKGCNTAFSVIEATSIGHLMGRPIIAAESFTSGASIDAYPWSLKNQGDWAFCAGINRFVFHTFPHQALGDAYKPGMTFGPYGVHWHRNQTWWPMVSAYHRYITRCSEILRQGIAVSDVLYLTPEGAPQVFLPPVSAVDGAEVGAGDGSGSKMPDKKGYGFDGCSPRILMARADVTNGLITFPGGSSYRLMVLPQVDTMTPALLAKIRDMVKAGATMVGRPPVKSPSLAGYPACDGEVKALAKDLWGGMDAPKTVTKRSYGKGVIHWGGEQSGTQLLYPSYDLTAAILKQMGVKEDFTATGPVRYGHRRTEDRDIYFVSNRTGSPIKADCRFRVGHGSAQIWDPVTGEQRPLPQFERADGLTIIPMEFDAFQSFFIVFSDINQTPETSIQNGERNFPELKPMQELSGAWEVAFDPKWGGPEKITFDTLQDWTARPELGIKYYSGIATYRKTLNLTNAPTGRSYLDLGVVHDMARARLNGKDLGVVWSAPWRVEVTGAIRTGDNLLEIEVVNRWANRLIGDKQPADANMRTVECPPGFFGGQPFKAGRYTYCLHDPYNAQSPLDPAGLLGPVTLQSVPDFK